MEPAHFGQLLGEISVGFGTVMEQTNDRDELHGQESLHILVNLGMSFFTYYLQVLSLHLKEMAAVLF